MQVYINKYKDHWISPYTIINYAFFWTDWSKCSRWTLTETLEDESRKTKGEKSLYVEHPEWVETWADRLEPVSHVIKWVWDKIDRKIDYVKIDKWDTWSMSHTLGLMALPMLKQLKDTKHGAPFVDDEDVPEHLRSTAAPAKENEWDTDDNHFKRWDWAMDEMIFAFEHHLDESWQDQYRSGEHDMVWTPVDREGNEVPKGEHSYYRMDRGPNDTYKCDYDAIREVEKRIQNGFRLFGKYYINLWD